MRECVRPGLRTCSARARSHALRKDNKTCTLRKLPAYHPLVVELLTTPWSALLPQLYLRFWPRSASADQARAAARRRLAALGSVRASTADAHTGADAAGHRATVLRKRKRDGSPDGGEDAMRLVLQG